MSGFHGKSVDQAVKLTLDFGKAGLGENEALGADIAWATYPEDGLLRITPVSEAEAHKPSAFLTGGRAGTTYFVTASGETGEGRVLKRCVVLRVSNYEEIEI